MIEEHFREPDVASRRTQPLYLEHPVTIIQEQVVELPSDWGVDPATSTVDDPDFLTSSSVNPSGKTVRIVSEFRSRSDRVEPADWERYLDDLKKSRQTIGWTIWHDTAAAAAPAAGPAKTPDLTASQSGSTGSSGDGSTAGGKGPEDWATLVGAVVATVVFFFAAALGMGSDW
jgi:hypothetical protein